MANKKFITSVLFFCLLGFNSFCLSQGIKKLVFENIKQEEQNKIENGGWSEWKPSLFGNSHLNIFTTLDFENKKFISTIFDIQYNSVTIDSLEMKDLILDTSKFPMINAKFKLSYIVSKVEYNFQYTFIGRSENGNNDNYLYYEVSYYNNNQLVSSRTRTYLSLKINE